MSDGTLLQQGREKIFRFRDMKKSNEIASEMSIDLARVENS